MTLWTCGAFTFAARLRENCVKCAGKGCLCCDQKGTHAEREAKFQRENVYGAFVINQAMWARPGKKEIA